MNSLHELPETLASITDAASKYVVAVRNGARFGASGVVWQEGVAVTTLGTLRSEENPRVGHQNSVPRACFTWPSKLIGAR